MASPTLITAYLILNQYSGQIDGDLSTSNDVDVENINGRKKRRNKIGQPMKWKSIERKNKRQKGDAYISMRGKNVNARVLKVKDCSKCKKKCNEKFTEEERRLIFEAYWNIGDLEKQRIYLSSLIDNENKHSKRTCSVESRRSKTNRYYMVKNQEKLEVCQKQFLLTFAVSEGFVRGIIRKRNEQNIIEPDKRGRHPPGLKRPDDKRMFIIDHINSFPRVPSHYCRKDTNKEYLPGDMNLQIMYNLYVDKCRELNIQPEKLWFYRHIFKTEFHISVHIPRKDMCDKCFSFNQLTPEQKDSKQDELDMHLKRKHLARNMKNSIKERAEKGECHLAEFDLEAVRYCPHTNAKKIFYKRRLAVYNLTVFNVATKYAYCYMWHEGVAKRGSIEIASCLWDYMIKLENSNEVNFFSDTCGGQNRNINMVSTFLYAVVQLRIETLNHFFFEPGHSQMECDSVHAQIEKKSKNIDIFHPSGWYTVVRLASKNSKYEVIEMDQSKFLDFNSLKIHSIQNRKRDTDGHNINWLQIVWIQFRKSHPDTIFFKYEMDAADFLSFNVRSISVRKSLRQQQRTEENTFLLKPAYNGPIPIDAKKMKDLIDLCDSYTIGLNYHPFYKTLQSSSDSTNYENNLSEQSD